MHIKQIDLGNYPFEKKIKKKEGLIRLILIKNLVVDGRCLTLYFKN
jgi:hypothetical protein